MINALSLGAGVQSSTLLMMSELGEIPRFDYAIFADTQGEPKSVYDWLDNLILMTSIPIKIVTIGSLEAREVRVRRSVRSGRLWMKNSIPAFVAKPDGKIGMLGRKCTLDFKIVPVTRKLRELAGIKRAPNDKKLVLVDQSLGISFDEVHRMKPSRESWIRHSFPLIDLKMTRLDCVRWMGKHDFPIPPRSACRFCPLHSNYEWGRLKAAEPAEFELAARFEEQLQAAAKGVLDGIPYLHRSIVPLREVIFKDDPKQEQLSMFGNECEGLCGV